MSGNDRPIRFGVFEVDLHTGELRKQGLKIKLRDQPFQILLLLLAHPGEVISLATNSKGSSGRATRLSISIAV
jgi:DNA-binding winged helix-turn-helix (wHTH) protein